MPKQRITKEMVVDAAFEIARQNGMEAVMVKTIAETLHCSVQPIYSYCTNMDALRSEVTQRAKAYIQAYIGEHSDPADIFRSTGHAYVQIAKQEPHLFKLYLFRERKQITSLEELYRTETNPAMAPAIADNLQISQENALRLHLHMLIYTIGIGMICSITSSDLSQESLYAQQEEAYQAFYQYIAKGK